MAADAAYQLSVFVDGEAVEIPANVGVFSTSDMASSFTTSADGQVAFTGGAGTTLGDFFDVWRTNAGLAGNNTDAVFKATEILGHVVDATHGLQLFVNGQVRTDYAEYVVADGDDVAIVYDSHPVVSLNTNFGAILVELYQDMTPTTVANFLSYVNSGAYVDTFFHRSAVNFVVQGGGFTTSATQFTSTGQFTDIVTQPPIQNEPGISNLRGTIAMAKLGGDPNSATSQWFFNLGDNSGNLNNQNGGFTVFGKALSMTAVDAIAALPVNTSNLAPFDELPVSAAGQLAVVASIEGLGSITGVRFVDANADGVRQAGELGQSGVVVYLDANDNGEFDSGEASTVTGADGSYRFDLLPGTYKVRAVGSATAALTLPAEQDHYTATVGVGSQLTGRDFGEWIATAPTALDLASASDTGSADDDNLTRLNNSSGQSLQFIVSGLVSGAEVRILANGTLIGAATAAGSSLTVATDGATTLADGDYIITATQSVNGVVSLSSTELVIHIDATAPASITTMAPTTVLLGSDFTYDPASAEEGQPGLAYSLSGGPAEMIIDPTTGAVSWPSAGPAVPQQFSIVLTDAAGNTTVEEVALTVLGAIPILPDSYQVNEDETLTVAAAGVLANDGDSQSGTLVASIVSQAAHGTVELNEDGSFSYVPVADYFGVDSFTYTATNGSETGNVALVTITVMPTPDPPAPAVDDYEAIEDTPLSVPVALGVLANDVEPDGDPLSASLEAAPTKGSLDFHADGSFTYTPDLNANGVDTFTYRVSDGTTTSSPVTVTLTIAAVNDRPTTLGESYSVDEDGTLTVDALAGVLKNDSDVDGDQLTAAFVALPAHGTLTLNADGSFTYVPSANYFGADSFAYVASDGTFQSVATTVSLTVNPVPDPPTASNDALSVVNDGSTHQIDVLANDSSSPDGTQTLRIDSVGQGSQGGAVSVNADGTRVLYVPATGFTGTETFTYTIRDSDGLTSSATVTAAVTQATQAATVSGLVYIDLNGNGAKDANERGIPGVLLTLTGTSTANASVKRGAITDGNGAYSFSSLPAGTYQVAESQPVILTDGAESSAAANAVVGADVISSIVVTDTGTSANNNFGEGQAVLQYASIAWFFASSQSSTAFLRNIVAQGAADSGNSALAIAIRAGNTIFDVSTVSAAAAPVSSSEIAESSAAVSPISAALVAEEPLGDAPVAWTGGTADAGFLPPGEAASDQDVADEASTDEAFAFTLNWREN